jgi:hypothetical protein
MNTAHWWLIGARLLGIYFVVIGAVTATGALMMAGVEIPVEMDRRIMVAVPILQAVVYVSAGAWLMRRSPVEPQDRHEVSTPVDGPFLNALRLLGVFFLITGAGTLLGAAVESTVVGTAWQFRTSQLTAGAVELLSGGALTFFSPAVAQVLQGVPIPRNSQR